MFKFIKPQIQADQEKIFRQLKLKPGSNAAEHAAHSLPQLYDLARNCLGVTTCYAVLPNQYQGILPGVDCCSHIVIGLITCSRDFETIGQQKMAEGQHLEAYLLDHLVSEILFNAANQLNAIIEAALLSQGLNLTCQYSPGENGIPPEIQGAVLELLKAEAPENHPLDVDMTESYMLIPVNSLLYYYGADAGIKGQSTLHDCSQCGAVGCSFRTEKMDDDRL
ncbi:hypothetical protein [Eubacterium barkeri]|uniref:Vitamin B12 dependent methionine synthase, activation domain n=1 Tax=Eubacterium barkeri TaxID=1528 RepID=A0A1H3I0H3_EUBBA|nr:hypothetical protein [Eubacterium barkeri]SDY20544.1 hypothetical protein SAMN04488579_12010 [Eubacterium barkeri]